jgi:hypothetical protein
LLAIVTLVTFVVSNLLGGRGAYVEQENFIVVTKHKEENVHPVLAGKSIALISNTEYYVEVEDDKYGKVEVENEDMYNSVSENQSVYLKVYKDKENNISVKW